MWLNWSIKGCQILSCLFREYRSMLLPHTQSQQINGKVFYLLYKGLSFHIVRGTIIGRFTTHIHHALMIREAAFI